MKTDTLLLNRSIGYATPEDYIEWAVERLCEGMDSPSLRILAGLFVRFELDDIEPCFNNSCMELGIEFPALDAGPGKTAWLVKRAYDQGEVSAESALHMMAALYSMSDYSDPLLSVWYEIEEELAQKGSGCEGYFYPPEGLDSVEQVFELEWKLFERASRLDLPAVFIRYIRCAQCGHIGEPQPRQKRLTLPGKLRAMIARLNSTPSLWQACSRCGSFAYHNMVDPDVRDTYLTQLEGEQAIPAIAA
jgi:hypothetical protein